MKVIKRILTLSLLVFTIPIFADNGIDWDEGYVTGSYSESTEVLSITSWFTSENTVSQEYSFVISILDKECKGVYQYSSFQLYGECNLSIPKDEIEGLYKVNILITNGFEGGIGEVNSKLEISGYESSFSWKDFQTESVYDNIEGTLSISGDICHHASELFDGYTIKLGGIENYRQIGDAIFEIPPTFKLELITKMNYDKDKGCLSFNVDVSNKWSIDDKVGYAFRVYDEENKKEGEGTLGFVIFEEIEENINWKALEWDYIYYRDENRVQIKVYAPKIEKEENTIYTIEINKDTKKLQYDNDLKQLYTEFEVGHNRYKHSREIDFDYIVRGDDFQKRGEGRLKIRLDYHKGGYESPGSEEVDEVQLEKDKENDEIQGEQNKETIGKNTVTTTSPSPIEVAVDAFIVRQGKRFSNTDELKNNLIRTTQLLDKYAESKPEYLRIVKELNVLILLRVGDM